MGLEDSRDHERSGKAAKGLSLIKDDQLISGHL